MNKINNFCKLCGEIVNERYHTQRKHHWLKDKKQSNEWKEKAKLSWKLRKSNPNYINPLKDKSKTKEHIRKIQLSRVGWKQNDETKKIISEKIKLLMTDERKKLISIKTKEAMQRPEVKHLFLQKIKNRRKREIHKIKINCIKCNKEVLVFPCFLNTRKYCSRECKNLWISENLNGKNSKTFGVKHNEITRQKISQSWSKNKNDRIRKISEKKKIWFKNKENKENNDKLLKKMRIKYKEMCELNPKLKHFSGFYGKKHREETIKKILIGQKRKPNNFELFLNQMLQNNFPNEWKYVGDGSFLIGFKNPDFINVNGKKVCIELYYSFYKIRDFNSVENYELLRYKYFEKYGYKTIFINTNILDNENLIIEKVKGVMNETT